MGLTLTLTDQEIPASPAFIEFLYATLRGDDYYVGEWFSQEEESLATNEGRFEDIQQKALEVLSKEEGKRLVIRSYRFFKEMLTGRPQELRSLAKFRFFFVVGIPRTGGTYLTKQLFRASGIDYKNVQNALAHDGFPHLAHLSFKEDTNIHTNSLLQLAEYLTMVELFYTKFGKLAYHGGIIVPKKFTKAIYNFPLIKELFGTDSNYLITLRHPLSVTRSVIEKSGGMPENRKFILRSAIERWAYDDWVHWGYGSADVLQHGYVEVMVEYWKRFHYQLALAGIPAMKTATLVPYGKDYMMGATATLYEEFGVDLEPEEFKVADPMEFMPEDEERADKILEDVAFFWESLGLTFPKKELSYKY